MARTVSHWRITSREVIARVLEQTRDQPLWKIRKAISAAYPFGQRRWSPYKLWLEEVNKALGGSIARDKFKNGDEPWFIILVPRHHSNDHIVRVECPWCDSMKKQRAESSWSCFKCAEYHDEIRKWLLHPDFIYMLDQIKAEPQNPIRYGYTGDWLLDHEEHMGLAIAFLKRMEEMEKPLSKSKRRKVTAC